MNNPQGTSFIPQRPTRGKVNPRRVRKIYIVTYLSYVLFFGSVLAAAGVFFYNISVDVQLEKQKQALAAERGQFNQSDIESIRDLEKRIAIAQERLDNHVSVLSIFESLEKSAIQTIQYVSFSYQRSFDEFPLVSFSGDSTYFNNVLFQRDVLESNPVLADATFKEVALKTEVNPENELDVQKIVTFTLEKEVDTSLIGYIPRDGSYIEVDQSEADMLMDEQEIFTDEDAAVSETGDLGDEEASEMDEGTNDNQ